MLLTAAEPMNTLERCTPVLVTLPPSVRESCETALRLLLLLPDAVEEDPTALLLALALLWVSAPPGTHSSMSGTHWVCGWLLHWVFDIWCPLE
jgi:hypothetical protein